MFFFRPSHRTRNNFNQSKEPSPSSRLSPLQRTPEGGATQKEDEELRASKDILKELIIPGIGKAESDLGFHPPKVAKFECSSRIIP